LPKTNWDDCRRIFVSKKHVADVVGLDVPGAGSYLLDQKQMSTLGTKTMKIGTSQRADLIRSLGVDPKGSPGPFAYTLPSTFDADGRAASGAAKGTKDKGFGTSLRFPSDKGQLSVGPGQYHRRDHSALSRGTGKTFGVSHRSYDKVKQPTHDGQLGAVSEGPGPPLWEDIEQSGSRANSVPRDRRFRSPVDRERNAVPGPGSYDRNERSMSSLKSFLSDTRSPGGTRFGKLPRKPRFRQHSVILANEKQNHGCWGYF
jgi:hypothetical protein